MVKLHYGKKTIEIKNDKFLSIEDQRNLLDGKFVVETSIGSDKSNKIRKTYYVGVLYDIFHAYEDGKISGRDAADKLQISASTFHRRHREYKNASIELQNKNDIEQLT